MDNMYSMLGYLEKLSAIFIIGLEILVIIKK